MKFSNSITAETSKAERESAERRIDAMIDAIETRIRNILDARIISSFSSRVAEFLQAFNPPPRVTYLSSGSAYRLNYVAHSSPMTVQENRHACRLLLH